MASKYVPPSKRGLTPKVVEITPSDFPSLSNNSLGSKPTFATHKSFASLATEWNEHNEEERLNQEYRSSVEKRELERRERESRNIVGFKKTYDDETHYQKQEEESPILSKDEWTTVNRVKSVRILSLEERETKERKAEEERLENEESVWHQTNGPDDWDYRDRRVNQ